MGVEITNLVNFLNQNDMKILVFDDNAFQRRGAVNQLGKDHDLTVVSTFDEAYSLIYDQKQNNFDIVLLDLLVPPGDYSLRDLPEEKRVKYEGEEMPLGPILAIFAMQKGIKRIGIISDAGHHANPAASALESIMFADDSIPSIRFIVSFNTEMTHPDTEIILEQGEVQKLKSYAGYPNVKNWKDIVERLCKE